MQFEKAYHFLVTTLENELPDYLSYHNANHTKNVVAAVTELATEEGVAGEHLLLLQSAALFHDAGFLEHHQEHEQVSCKIARQYLPGFGYSVEAITQICKMILTTRLPQSADDELSRLLCDADLYYLGGPHYFEQAAALFQEFVFLGLIAGMEEWQVMQINFLQGHQYYTDAAKSRLEGSKQNHLQQLKQQKSVLH